LASGDARNGAVPNQDFETWTPKQLIFTTDDKDGYPWTQPYGLAVTAYGDQLIGVLWLLHLDEIEGNNSLGDEDTQLIVSRDGRKWERVADLATFLASTPGAWDEGRIHAPTTSMFVKDDRVYIYYSATNTRHGSGDWGSPGIGLATLRADRFVALRQQIADVAGVVETPLLKAAGNELLVNADVDGRCLLVELLNDGGRVIAGFDRDCCRLVAQDDLRYRVQWESRGKWHSLGAAVGRQPFALRFIINNGALFAI